MAAEAIVAGASVWLDGEDWSWPGRDRGRAELGPPSWIPSVPRRGAAMRPPRPAPPAPATARPRDGAAVTASATASAAPATARRRDGAAVTAGVTASATPAPVAPDGAALVAALPARPRATAPSAAARRFTIDAGGALAAPRPRRRRARRRVALQRVLACAALAGVFAATYEVAVRLQGPASSFAHGRGEAGARAAPVAQPAAVAGEAGSGAAGPALRVLSHDADGAALARVRFSSPALGGASSFLVYLPPGFRAGGTTRYPVLYLLHGDDQGAGSALQFGLTSTLDRVIDAGEVHPMLVVIPQGRARTYNWRNVGALRYEDYVIEVQRLTDRLLPTIADRSGRAIAGFSMGGYGAMNVALDHLDRFSVAESWLGFFNGLDGELHADASRFALLPLTAYVYGGAADSIADPSENPTFAAALRHAGASAQGAVYPGGHDFGTLHAHLRHMLVFAGHALAGDS